MEKNIDINATVEKCVVTFLNNYAHISKNIDAKRACFQSAETIEDLLFIDKEAVTLAMVKTICNSTEIIDRRPIAILNLQHYTDTLALPHHITYENNECVMTYLFPYQYNIVQKPGVIYYEKVKGMRY